MNILEVFQSFKTQEQAIEYLEQVRWKGEPVCPYCNSKKTHRHASGDRADTRWQCQECTRAFSVKVGTIFHGTHIELQKWFLLLALMLNAKKSSSACQIARDLGMRRPTVWRMMHKVRAAMATDMEQSDLLHGIVEADETYIGGKPRRPNSVDKDDDSWKSKPGRGTKKTPVVGVVERHGQVRAMPAEKRDLSARGLTQFIKRFVDPEGSHLMTDEYRSYRRMGQFVNHSVIKHTRAYVEGNVHTNTIEGFWALLKRAWFGQHHQYSNKYMDLYVSEACYKYNRREHKCSFDHLLGLMVQA